MKTHRLLSRMLMMLAVFTLPVLAHDEPTSFIEIHMSSVEMRVDVTASVTDIAHDLRDLEPRMLLNRELISDRKAEISGTIASRMQVSGDGEAMTLPLVSITPVPEKGDLLMVFSHKWMAAPANLQVDARLFPYDPGHRTFVNVYAGDDILRQAVLTAAQPEISFRTTDHQEPLATMGTFIRQGIHHIFIGPDHILFVVGLMLLGGNLQRLLTIITAFTVAHSITLALATFRILTPPANIVEPVIAFSIVVVGIHAFFGSTHRDPRLVFAFCFGLIHGFGFASVLQQMVLPREALGLSLFSFNAGVEIGQGIIVLLVAPLLAMFRMAYPLLARVVVSTGSLAVVTIGAFWFFQRVSG